MPKWTNNFNDNLVGASDTSTAGFSGNHTGSATTIALSSFELTDLDGNGHANWAANDTFFVTGSAATQYTISSISTNEGASDASHLVITPGLVHDITSHTVVEKWAGEQSGGYQGNQGNVAKHLRLRNQGQI